MKYVFVSCGYIFLLLCGVLYGNQKDSMRFTVNTKARFKQNVRMDKKLSVHGKAHFDDDVECKDDVKIKKNLIIKGGLTVKNGISVVDMVFGDVSIVNLSVIDTLTTNSNSVQDQTVGGTLSATSTTVGCDLTVNGDINMNDSINPSKGNIIKKDANNDQSRFIHNAGTNNTFMGTDAGNFSLSGDSNIGVGVAALESLTIGSSNTAIGRLALNSNINGDNNVAVGVSAMQNNRIGAGNIAIGNAALVANTQGNGNIAVGTRALQSSNFSFDNVAIGWQAAFGVGNIQGNVIIGHAAGSNFSSGVNNIYIGNEAGPSALDSSSEFNTIRIGGEGYKRAFIAGIINSTIIDSIAVYVDMHGQLGIAPSSKRFKHDIVEMQDESARIYNLNPVTFVYNSDPAAEVKQYGLIAEEVVEVFPEMVMYDKEGLPFSVRYAVLPVLLLNEIKNQKRIMEHLRKKIEIVKSLKNKAQDFNDLNAQVKTFLVEATSLKRVVEKCIVCS